MPIWMSVLRRSTRALPKAQWPASSNAPWPMNRWPGCAKPALAPCACPAATAALARACRSCCASWCAWARPIPTCRRSSAPTSALSKGDCRPTTPLPRTTGSPVWWPVSCGARPWPSAPTAPAIPCSSARTRAVTTWTVRSTTAPALCTPTGSRRWPTTVTTSSAWRYRPVRRGWSGSMTGMVSASA